MSTNYFLLVLLHRGAQLLHDGAQLPLGGAQLLHRGALLLQLYTNYLRLNHLRVCTENVPLTLEGVVNTRQ